MKISFVTTYDPMDVLNWSGLSYHLAQALSQQQADIEYIGNLKHRHRNSLRVKKLLYAKIAGCKFMADRVPSVADDYARQISKRISPSSDCVFCPGSTPIARLVTSRPKAFYTDATFAGMLGFYASYSNLCAESIRYGHQLEQEALSSSALAIYASDWAARTAIEHYNVDPARVKVVPFGANLESDRSYEDIKKILTRRSKSICKLLFLGVEWERKGGALAVETARLLNQNGIPTELHMAGLQKLPMDKLPEFVRNYGFISKATSEGRDRLDQLMMDCHFLILPTRAEAYGLVFCEANSFGMPAIATTVGGIPTIIKDDINGRLFPLSAPASAYAGYIGQLFANFPAYSDMALSSFHEYATRLNWKVAGKTIVELLRDL
jgi:glycosyltransferase involved in cell wall biosynthesis